VLPLPLVSPAWGVLLIERRGWQTFERDELALANEFVQKATHAVEAAANDRALRRSAEFDALTGAFNRRTVNVRLDAGFKHSLARNSPFAVLFVDLDHLKELNDKHGHAAGDSSLCMLAETLSRHCEKKGEYGRYGGDEFVVMLPDMSPEQARSWAEAMRVDATSHDLAFVSGKLRLSVSVGVASRRPEDVTVQELVERADKALYEAKRMGRDRVQVAAAYGAVRASGTQ
jgi:diguanylate cyclase (GGDEF)-like protein